MYMIASVCCPYCSFTVNVRCANVCLQSLALRTFTAGLYSIARLLGVQHSSNDVFENMNMTELVYLDRLYVHRSRLLYECNALTC